MLGNEGNSFDMKYLIRHLGVYAVYLTENMNIKERFNSSFIERVNQGDLKWFKHVRMMEGVKFLK